MTARRHIASPVGVLTIEAQDGALTALHFGRRGQPQGQDDVLDEAERQLAEYFSGKRRAFSLPTRPHGTPFQLEVWAELGRIPFGQQRSYGQLAALIGRPKAARAVGGAAGRNPLGIIVPCHRLLAAGGGLGGFSGGLDAKRALLALEGIPFAEG